MKKEKKEEEEEEEDGELRAVRQMLTTDSEVHAKEYAAFRERVLLAEEHLAEGEFAEAVAAYEAVARAFRPNFYFGELYLGLGCAFVGLGQHAHAVQIFDRALQHDPHNSQVYLNKGLALVITEQMAEALETFRQGLLPAKRAREADLVVQLQLYCGQLYEELGDDDAALNMYHEALQESPEYSQLWYLAGCIHAKRNDRLQAEKYFREALACSNPWPSAYYKLSRLVADEEERKQLYAKFVASQTDMAKSGRSPRALQGSDSPGGAGGGGGTGRSGGLV